MDETLDRTAPAGHGAEELDPARRRVRLVDLRRDASPAGTVAALTVLETRDGALHTGRAELPARQGNYLRAACRATLTALAEALDRSAELELIGLRTVKVGESHLVVVQLAVRDQGEPRLLQGVAVASDSPDLDAARAVLHATNRLVERVLQG